MTRSNTISHLTRTLLTIVVTLTTFWAVATPQETGLTPPKQLLERNPHFSDLSYEESFVRPNERRPKKALPIWKESSSGTYVSVGTERGFIGFANSKADSLVMVDFHPYVVTYNETNRILLKLATSFKDYVALKKSASFKEIYGRMKDSQRFSESELSWVQSAFVEKLWNESYRSSGSFMGRDFWAKLGLGGFAQVSYMVTPDLFEKLSRAARENRIVVRQGNLNNQLAQVDLGNLVDKLGGRLSVLDLSNAWESHFIRPEPMNTLTKRMQERALTTSLILLTNIEGLGWSYYAVPILSFDPKHVFFSHRDRLEYSFPDEQKNRIIYGLPLLCSKILE